MSWQLLDATDSLLFGVFVFRKRKLQISAGEVGWENADVVFFFCFLTIIDRESLDFCGLMMNSTSVPASDHESTMNRKVGVFRSSCGKTHNMR